MNVELTDAVDSTEMQTFALYTVQIKQGRARYWKIGIEIDDKDTGRFWDVPLREWIEGGGTWFDLEERAEKVVAELYERILNTRVCASAGKVGDNETLHA